MVIGEVFSERAGVINMGIEGIMLAAGATDWLFSLMPAITRSVDFIGKPPVTMSRDEKIRAFKFLKDSGAFLITGSGDIISNYYGISKYTLYTYINQDKYSNK